MKTLSISGLILFILFNTANAYNMMKVDQDQVNKWNNFVSELHQLHVDLTSRVPIATTETAGGYGGAHANKNFYHEISYFNKNTNQIISRIQWETAHPDTIHAIEIYLYDNQGRVKVDYYARFLPEARNAPIQTLINLHNYRENLHSFRQFDASGELIYETCRGKFYNEVINLHLDDEEIEQFRNENTDELLNEAYAECFHNASKSADDFLNPAIFIQRDISAADTNTSTEQLINKLNARIKSHPSQAQLYINRGDLLFSLHNFTQAIKDYNTALSLNKSLYQAYFGRGMALARDGQVDAGIKDLSVYIKYDPRNSRAYTKRGVRYIWAGNLELAKQDLLMAIKIDNRNSEAHDDLGVIYAQEKKYDTALKHFSFAVQYDPTYQKAYHNQAMIYTLQKNNHSALAAINKSLELNNDSRNSLILKSEILNAMGKTKEATKVMNKAEFLPEGNWSERFPAQ